MKISSEYLEQQKQLHKNPNYGVVSLQYAQLALKLIDHMSAKSVSNYGAGKCNLQKKLKELGRSDIQYFPYDPAFAEYGEPKEANMVCCIDVLEHVEAPYVKAVLLDLRRITVKVGLITIHTGPAAKHPSDGRNAHLIQKPASWWLPQLCGHFEIAQLQRAPGGFWVVVENQSSS